MRLNDTLVQKTLSQLDAQAIPENHPVVPQLSEMFGDHTFFLGTDGLSIVEPVDAPDIGGQAGQVVNIASWQDASRSSLAPHEPEPTDLVIVLETEN